MEANGHAKALMSYNFHNVEISRPVPADASDEYYRRELGKAIQLCQEGVRKLQNLNEDQKHFYDLLDEYLYVKRVAEAVESRDEPPNEAEQAAIARYKRLHQFCFEEHTVAWLWEDRLYEAMADSLEDDMPF